MKLLPLNSFKTGTIVRVKFTRDVCRTFLNANTENRSLNIKELDQYIWDMKNGYFDFGAVPICVCPSRMGNGLILADGQTRLQAMLKAGAFGTCFVRCITREQRQYLNGGRRNSFRDREKMGSAPADSPSSENVVKTFIKFVEDSKLYEKDFISDARCRQTFSKFADFIGKMKPARHFTVSRKRKVPHGVFVAILEHHIGNDADDCRLLAFLDRVCSPNLQNEEAPEKLSVVITTAMDNPRNTSGHGRTAKTYLATKAAVDAWINGTTITKKTLEEIIENGIAGSEATGK